MKNTVLLACFAFTAFNCFAQATFQKLYSVTNYTYFTDLDTTSDGGFIVSGFGGATASDHIVLKLDSNGNIQWARHYGFWAGTEQSSSINESSAGGYYLSGYSDGNSMWGDGNMVRIASSGSQQWNKLIQQPNTPLNLVCMRETPSGDFVAAGTCTDSATYYLTLTKTTASGGLLWSKGISAGPGSYSSPADMTVHTSGSYTLFGEGAMTSSPTIGHFVVNMDQTGNLNWSKLYEEPNGYSYACNIEPTDDGGYILGGKYLDINSQYHFMLTKLDAAGNVNWSKRYFSPQVIATKGSCLKIKQTSDQGYIGCDVIYDMMGYAYPSFLRFDSAGNFVWAKYYTSYMADGYTHSRPRLTSNGKIAACFGVTDSTFSQNMGCVLKIDPNGNSSCPSASYTLNPVSLTFNIQSPGIVTPLGSLLNVKHTEDIIPVSVSSNCQSNVGLTEAGGITGITILPGRDPGIFLVESMQELPGDIHVYDVIGQLIKIIPVDRTSALVDISEQACGLYLFSLQSKGQTFNAKVIYTR